MTWLKVGVFSSRAGSRGVSNTVQSAQYATQYSIDSFSLDDGKIATSRGAPDLVPVLNLGSILKDVHDTTICLMRLSKPLLDSHRCHQNDNRPCDEDDEHHVSHLQRLFPHATLATLKRLSKSICSRRLELLRMNSHREGLYPALGDDAFLRMVLLDLASISDEAIKYEANTRSSFEADSGRPAAEPGSLEDAEMGETPREERSKLNTGETESLMVSPEYTPEDLEPSTGDTTQRRKGLLYDTKSHTGRKAKEASFIDYEVSDDRPEAVTLTTCTRCRVVRLTRV